MNIAALTTAYLAPVEYYSKLFNYDKIILEAHDNYIKQTYRNRCFIGAANDRLSLSIPVEKSEGSKTLTRDIRISDHGNWRHQHWYAISSTYNNSPFFEFYEDDLHPFFEKKFDFLFDFNEQLRALICELIGFTPNIVLSEDYEADYGLDVSDFRDIIHPKRDYKELDKEFIDINYYQLFEQKWGFRPNLSIIDLLFNMGPESLLVLKDSFKNGSSR